MTEKKSIIIDNVDVSKCDYFNNTDECYCEERCSKFGCTICNDRPNCYFKQLERKTKDEQSLLNVIDYLQQQKNKFEAYYKGLVQDFDELKTENEILKKKLKQIIDEENNEKNSR